MGKSAEWQWGPEQQQAFCQLWRDRLFLFKPRFVQLLQHHEVAVCKICEKGRKKATNRQAVNHSGESLYLRTQYSDLPPVANLMPDLVLACEGILSLLLNVKMKKSSSTDGIPNAFFVRYSEIASCYLYVLFNASINQSFLPADSLTARVVSVFKLGNRLTACN